MRISGPGDAEFLHAVYASTREDELAPVPWTEEQKAAFLRQQSEAQREHYTDAFPDCEWLVVSSGGRDVGRMIVDRGVDEIRLMDVALLTGERGRGVGTRMLSDLMAEADRTGKPIRLHVETFNPALAWYQRLGFESVRVVRDIHVQMLYTPRAADERKAG